MRTPSTAPRGRPSKNGSTPVDSAILDQIPDYAEGRTTERAPAHASDPLRIVLPRIERHVLHVRVVGVSPLVQRCFSAKARSMIEEAQQGKARAGKIAKNPVEECQSALHAIAPDVYGIPAHAFKRALVDACRDVPGLSMTEARAAFFVTGEEDHNYCRIETASGRGKPKWAMRTDMVRVGPQKAVDVRYRPEFSEWAARLAIEFKHSTVTAEQLLQLVQYAGYFWGVGEMRPGKTGMTFGRFCIDRETPPYITLLEV